MRTAKKWLAMGGVTLAFASSVAYVIPNAQAVGSPVALAEQAAADDPQVLGAMGADVAGSTISRDGYGVTLPPPPPPPPPAAVRVEQASSSGSSGRSFTLIPSSSSAELQWPMAPGTPMVSGFGPRSCSGCSSFHQGADFTAPAGTPIWAMAAGVVTEANASGPFGVHAVVQHVIDGQVVTTLYAHMTQGTLAVSVGDVVVAGQPLGGVGCTGSCTGNHLHFEVHPGGGAAVDPVAWLANRIG